MTLLQPVIRLSLRPETMQCIGIRPLTAVLADMSTPATPRVPATVTPGPIPAMTFIFPRVSQCTRAIPSSRAESASTTMTWSIRKAMSASAQPAAQATALSSSPLQTLIITFGAQPRALPCRPISSSSALTTTTRTTREITTQTFPRVRLLRLTLLLASFSI